MCFCKYANYVTLCTLNVSKVVKVRQLRQPGQYLTGSTLALWFLIDTCVSFRSAKLFPYKFVHEIYGGSWATAQLAKS